MSLYTLSYFSLEDDGSTYGKTLRDAVESDCAVNALRVHFRSCNFDPEEEIVFLSTENRAIIIELDDGILFEWTACLKNAPENGI